ncbi:hypothetical protein ACFLUH_03455 [Chloroflexota bacterium]
MMRIKRNEIAVLTEVRDYGDKRTVVVYTNDNEVCRKLRDSRKCFRIVSYEQQQNGKTVLVGVDLYFSKKDFTWLKEHLEYPQSGNF